MHDLGFLGSKFTWSNLCRNNKTIRERLDRFAANSEWLELFPESFVRHLPRTHSDHCLLLLTLTPYISVP